MLIERHSRLQSRGWLATNGRILWRDISGPASWLSVGEASGLDLRCVALSCGVLCGGVLRSILRLENSFESNVQ